MNHGILILGCLPIIQAMFMVQFAVFSRRRDTTVDKLQSLRARSNEQDIGNRCEVSFPKRH